MRFSKDYNVKYHQNVFIQVFVSQMGRQNGILKIMYSKLIVHQMNLMTIK
jgi:hypothetical protein